MSRAKGYRPCGHDDCLLNARVVAISTDTGIEHDCCGTHDCDEEERR